jgi:tetratricopeptide (TPR) repeat protein
VVGLQIQRDRNPPLSSGQELLLYVRSPEAMKRMALSYDSLVADIYWMRAIQHYGDTKTATDGRTKTYDLLYPLLDLTTSLDPLFDTAYQFGSIFLAEPPPGGPGKPEAAVALLRKGIAAQPDDWRMVQSLGFVYYWWYQDYKAAAEWFERAAKVPGAPNWLNSLAAVTLTNGGDRNASRQMWRDIAQNDSNEWFRNEAARRLRQLDAMDQMDELNRRLATFETRAGRAAVGWADLVRAGLLRGVPVDPTGLPYQLTGHAAMLSPQSTLLPLPVPARAR